MDEDRRPGANRSWPPGSIIRLVRSALNAPEEILREDEDLDKIAAMSDEEIKTFLAERGLSVEIPPRRVSDMSDDEVKAYLVDRGLPLGINWVALRTFVIRKALANPGQIPNLENLLVAIDKKIKA